MILTCRPIFNVLGKEAKKTIQKINMRNYDWPNDANIFMSLIFFKGNEN